MFTRKRLTQILYVLTLTILPLLFITSPGQSVNHWSSSDVTVKSSSWLDGKGVQVYRSRQCVELATRLYTAKNWGTLNNIYSSRPADKKIVFKKNSKGHVPVSGDVILESGGSYGHVAVVDKVKGKQIHAVEQNAAASGRKIYVMKGESRTITGAYSGRSVKGFLHSKVNKNR